MERDSFVSERVTQAMVWVRIYDEARVALSGDRGGVHGCMFPDLPPTKGRPTRSDGKYYLVLIRRSAPLSSSRPRMRLSPISI